MGKRSLENKINEEGRYLARYFEEQNGRPFDPQPAVQYAVANVICSISFGDRYDYDDPEFRQLLDYLKVLLYRIIQNLPVTKVSWEFFYVYMS